MVPKYWKLLQYIGSRFNILQVVSIYCKWFLFIGSRFELLQVTLIYWKSFPYIGSSSRILEVVSIYCKSLSFIGTPIYCKLSYIASRIANCPYPAWTAFCFFRPSTPDESRAISPTVRLSLIAL